MKMILRSFIYLAASVVISLYDAMRAIHPAADRQDKKRSNDNTRDDEANERKVISPELYFKSIAIK